MAEEKMKLDDVEDLLKKIAGVLGYEFVDDGEYMFFSANRCKWPPSNVTRIYPIYGHKVACEKLMHDIVSRLEFYDGKTNPFYGCKSIEEALVKADLLGA